MFKKIKAYTGSVTLDSNKNVDEVIQILDSLIDLHPDEQTVQSIVLLPFIGQKQNRVYHITNASQKIKILQAHYDITVTAVGGGGRIKISAYCSNIAEQIIHIGIGFSVFITLMMFVSLMFVGFVGIIVMMALAEYLIVFLFAFHFLKIFLNKEYEKTVKIISEHLR